MRSFEDPELEAPQLLLLDTSFVVEALLGSQPLHGPCLTFLVRLAEEGAHIAFSRLLEIELAEAAFQIALKERHPRDWKRYRGDGRARPRAARLMTAVRRSWEDVLSIVPHRCVEIGDIAEAVPELMQACGLASYDAVHVATAISVGADAIATTDAGFANAPASVQLLVDNSRLAACRRRRK